MTEEQYPDPPVEAAQRLAQALLPVATLADVAARMAAARRQRQAEHDEHHTAELRRRLAAEHAQAAAAYAPALHPEWVATASLAGLGAAWRAAHRYAAADPRAAEAADRVEERLRGVHPVAMHRYDTLRAHGATPSAAMADAARIMATVHPHPHGTTRRPGLDAAVPLDTAAGHAAAAAYTPGLNPHWLGHAGLRELAAVWRAAHQHADSDTRAAHAAGQVEQQLRRLHPPAMRHYDQLRAAGHSPTTAMRQAAVFLAFVDPTARRGHPAPERPQLTPGADDGHDPAAAPGPPGPAAGPGAGDALDARSGRDRAAAAAAAATPDAPATTRIDEHSAGVQAAGHLNDSADRQARTAAALRAQMYPQPITTDLTTAHAPRPPATPAPPLSKRPAATR